MLQPKAVARFSILFVVVYSVLTWTWPRLEPAYAAGFRAFANVTFSQFWFWPDARVHFFSLREENLLKKVNDVLPVDLPDNFALPGKEGVRDTLMVLTNRSTPDQVGFLRTSSRMIGYTPIAVLISLVIATPIPWMRRLWLLIGSMVLVHFFIAIRLTALLLDTGYAADKGYALFRPGPFMLDVLRRTNEVLAVNPTFSYIAAVFIWVLLLVVMQIWHARRNPSATNEQPAPRP